MIKTVSILGSTGSIGRQSLAAAEHLGVRVRALSANRDIVRLEEQARKYKPEFISVFDETAAQQLRVALADTPVRVGSGMQSLREAAVMDDCDAVVTAVSGSGRAYPQCGQ